MKKAMLSQLPPCLPNQFLSFILGHTVQYKHDMNPYMHPLPCIPKTIAPYLPPAHFAAAVPPPVNDVEAAE